jgi:hypothetical protein
MRLYPIILMLARVMVCTATLATTGLTMASPRADYDPSRQSPEASINSIVVPSPRYDVDHTIYLFQHMYPVSVRGERIRLWRSTNRGISWDKVFEYTDRYRAGGNVVAGFPVFGRHTPTVYLRFNYGIPGEYELWHSIDGGDTWEERTLPFPGGACYGPVFAGESQTLFSPCIHLWLWNYIGIDRSIDTAQTWNRVWSTTGIYEVVSSPSFVADGTLFASVQLGYEPPPLPKLIASFDGGDTWQPRDVGLCNMVVNSIALSPDFAQDRTLFAIQNGIIFKSQNAGQSWLQVYAEDNRQCEDSTSIYSHNLFVSPNYAQDRTLFWLNEGVLYASYDDGLSWQRLTRSTSVSNVAIRRSPAPVAALPEPVALVSQSSTGASSAPGRTTGYQVFLPLVMQRGPQPLPLTIFASLGGSNTPHRSDDGGITWTPVSLPPATEVYLPLIFASP